MWTAIKYVGSAVTLAAFVAAVAAWVYRWKLLEKERLLRAVPEADRAALAERTLVLFKIDPSKLKREQRYDLALRQIQEHARRYRTTSAVVVIIASLTAALTAVALLRPGPSPPAGPSPDSPPASSAQMKLSGRIDRVEVAENPGGGSQVFILLSVRNEGPPTTAHKYFLRISQATSKSIDFKGQPDELDRRFALPQAKGVKELVVEPRDAIAGKTAEAIAQGKEVSGWMRFALPLPMLKPEFLRQPGVRYAVSFADVTGKTYEAVYETH